MKLFIVMCVLLMQVGCLSTIPQKVEFQANQLQLCPDELPLVEGTTGADLTLALVQWGAIYHDCRLRHNSLVQTIKETKNDNTN